MMELCGGAFFPTCSGNFIFGAFLELNSRIIFPPKNTGLEILMKKSITLKINYNLYFPFAIKNLESI